MGKRMIMYRNFFLSYEKDMLQINILGQGLRFDRNQPTFVRRFDLKYLSIGNWDVSFY